MTLKPCLRNIFMDKSCRKCAPKDRHEPTFDFGK